MKKQRVLLVDDSLKFLEVVKNMIKNNNNVKIIGSVSSGEEAIRITTLEHPDLILMDVSMPGMGGLMATRMIKKMGNPPKVIILTLYDTSEYREEAKAAGADGFISKLDFVEKIPDIFPGKLRQ
ncbi:MAG: response regulator [Paludibacter sp.]